MSKTKIRRHRLPVAKPGELKVAFGEEYPGAGKGLVYLYGAYGAYPGHAHALMAAFERLKVEDGLTLAKFLAKEGFDITTLKFSISRAEPRARDGTLPPEP